jgi:hypothetical protein
MSTGIPFEYDEEVSSSDQYIYDAYSGLEIFGTELDADELDYGYQEDTEKDQY